MFIDHLSILPHNDFSNNAGAPCGQYEPTALLRGSGRAGERTASEVPSNLRLREGVRRPRHPLVSEARLCLRAVESEGHSPAPGLLQGLI